jgi:hypothetical protein
MQAGSILKSTFMAEDAMAEPDRTGRKVMQPTGYRAFIPAALPYDPPLRYAPRLLALLSEADQELARLDAATEFLPNPDLFVRMYVRKEAVLSSQIEGTQKPARRAGTSASRASALAA